MSRLSKRLKWLKSVVKSPLIVLMIPLLLTGCFEAHSSSGFTVIEYSKDIQAKAGEEMREGLSPTLNMMMNDYSVLRDQARVK